MRLPGWTLLLATTLALPACANRVVSEKPWFDAAQAAASTLRDGVWRAEDAACKVVETEPAEQWPACASWSYVRPGQFVGLDSNKGGKSEQPSYEWSPIDHVLVAGEPMIDQLKGCALTEKAQAAVDAGREPEASDPDALTDYCYAAIKPISRDERGQIVRVETWPVLCGPWGEDHSKVTRNPWPGLTVVKDNCTAADEASLREAARRSYEVARESGDVQIRHWVRDGYR